MRKMLLIYLMFLGFLFSQKALAMEPDEESLRDPKFVAEHGCLTDHFLLKGLFEKEQWNKANKLIRKLEGKGYSDRFLTGAKAKIFTKQGNYKKALEGFYKALDQKYICHLTAPKYKFAQKPDLFDDAVLWYFIYQLYDLIGKKNKASLAHDKSEELIIKSMCYEPTECVRGTERNKILVAKVFL
jgi:tetratricopeptide (TPR) repeat protein